MLSQIRLFLKEQSDQGLHCLPFCLHLLEAFLCGRNILFEFQDNCCNFLGCPVFFLQNFLYINSVWYCPFYPILTCISPLVNIWVGCLERMKLKLLILMRYWPTVRALKWILKCTHGSALSDFERQSAPFRNCSRPRRNIVVFQVPCRKK